MKLWPPFIWFVSVCATPLMRYEFAVLVQFQNSSLNLFPFVLPIRYATRYKADDIGRKLLWMLSVDQHNWFLGPLTWIQLRTFDNLLINSFICLLFAMLLSLAFTEDWASILKKMKSWVSIFSEKKFCLLPDLQQS